jgi:hypothetical protein
MRALRWSSLISTVIVTNACTRTAMAPAGEQLSNGVARTRSGSFAHEWFTLRSAHRGDATYFPNQTRDGVGFRVARTIGSTPR